MASPLAPNKIHHLPVIVHYHLPSSSHTFTTLFPVPQQVYVHPNAASRGEGEEEVWGSIYLKTVVLGMLASSPELYPGYQSVPDLSLCILDPRETFLRRSRASSSIPVHLRPSHASSSASDLNSSAVDGPSQQTQEVWTGKGLISWALDEPGQGKNLITGRLIRSTDFTATSQVQGLSPLEALMLADCGPQDDSWGVEVTLSLKSGAGGPSGVQPANQQVAAMPPVASRRHTYVLETRSDAHSPVPSLPRHISFDQPLRETKPLPLPRRESNTASHLPRPLSPSRTVSATPQFKAQPVDTTNKKHSSGKRKKIHHSSIDRSSHHRKPSLPLAKLPPAASSSTSAPKSDASIESFPIDIPAALYTNPASLTKEQAERLIASPAFLSMLEDFTGQPIQIGSTAKRPRSLDERDVESAKKVKLEQTSSSLSHWHPPSHTLRGSQNDDPSVLKCWNCGRTKSAVWRMKVMDDGKAVRVCNACGLYWNKQKSMRPPPLWKSVDAEVAARRSKKESGASEAGDKAESAPAPAPRMDSSHFKRTLSTVAEQDAKRIASLRARAITGSNLKYAYKASPMTSPPRTSTSAAKAVRNAKWNENAQAGASSPGGWVESMHPSTVAAESEAYRESSITESPGTTIRKILGTNMPLQTLDLPLSDDGQGDGSRATGSTQYDWSTDLSAFFDVEKFSVQPESDGSAGPSNGSRGDPLDMKRAVSSVFRKRRDGTVTETEDEEVLSQLFNRTSSLGMPSSPFDFSQLPPSSPPVLQSDLPHSALLLSSPDNSPLEYSPVPADERYKISPEKSRSMLQQSFTPVNIDEKMEFRLDDFRELLSAASQDSDRSAKVGQDFAGAEGISFEVFQELFDKVAGQGSGSGEVSSAGLAEGTLGEDWMKLLGESLVEH